MAKFTCPFCMREYPIKNVQYVCPDDGTVTTPGTFEREPIKCSKCGGIASRRVCPSCSAIIPRTALETPNLPFSIVGVSNSGKTNYITVMLHELSQAQGLRLALGSQTKETQDHQRENFQTIYEDRTPPPPTPSGERMPQIWYIRNLNKKHGNTVPTYTFTIFDGAGEDYENMLDTSSTECRYISASKAIMLVVDPLVLSQVRKGGVVDPQVLRNSLGGSEGETKSTEDVINGVVDYIKAARGIKASQQLKIPVAVVLTKFDTLLNHPAFGSQALVRSESMSIRNGAIDTTEFDQVDEEIRNWLRSIGESPFIDTLEANFTDFRFFGVSSYGSPPTGVHSLAEIHPHRVLDPILWLFNKEGFID